jgi:O-antigen/teichoic acid export membrane protein
MISQKESLSEKFIRKGFWIYFFVALTAPLGYIIKMVLAEGMSKAEVGILYTSVSLLLLIGTYTDLWLTESLNYFLPRYILRKAYTKVKLLIFTTAWVQILSSTIVGLLFYFLAWFLATYYFADPKAEGVLKILALFFFGMHILQINMSFFSAIQNTKFQKWVEFLRMFVTMIGVVVLFFSWTGNIISYTWMWISWVYIAIIVSTYLSYHYYYKLHFSGIPLQYDIKILRKFFKYSLGTLIAANIATLLHQLDQQFIAYFVWAEEAGIYTMYLSLISIPFILFTPIIFFLFPVVSELHESWEKKKLQLIFTSFSSYLSSFMLWIWWFFFILGPQIAVFFYSTNYILSGEATRYVSFFLLWNILIQICFQFLAGLWHIKKRITITAITLIVNIFLVLIMIWVSKNTTLLPSASSGVSIAVGISWIVMWYLSYKALEDLHWAFQWNIFFLNLWGVILWWAFLLFSINTSSFLGNVSSRLWAFIDILFAFCLGAVIFLVINKKSLGKLFEMIRSTKNIIKS